MTSPFKPAFPYIRPNTSVYIKANTTPAVKRDVVGTILSEQLVPKETVVYAKEANRDVNSSVEQGIVYILCPNRTMLCIAESAFSRHVAAGNIRVYG